MKILSFFAFVYNLSGQVSADPSMLSSGDDFLVRQPLVLDLSFIFDQKRQLAPYGWLAFALWSTLKNLSLSQRWDFWRLHETIVLKYNVKQRQSFDPVLKHRGLAGVFYMSIIAGWETVCQFLMNGYNTFIDNALISGLYNQTRHVVLGSPPSTCRGKGLAMILALCLLQRKYCPVSCTPEGRAK